MPVPPCNGLSISMTVDLWVHLSDLQEIKIDNMAYKSKKVKIII